MRRLIGLAQNSDGLNYLETDQLERFYGVLKKCPPAQNRWFKGVLIPVITNYVQLDWKTHGSNISIGNSMYSVCKKTHGSKAR